jgi:hypothetical protein
MGLDEERYVYVQRQVSNKTIQPGNFKLFMTLLSMLQNTKICSLLKAVFILLIKINSRYEMESINDEAQWYYINAVYFFSNTNN